MLEVPTEAIRSAKACQSAIGNTDLPYHVAGMVIWLSRSHLDFICMAAFLFPFYADELITMVVRLKNRENLTRPHRRHLYQLLANERGISQWKIAAGYGLFQLIVGVSILILRPFGDIMVLLLIAVYFGAFIVVSCSVRKKVNVRG